MVATLITIFSLIVTIQGIFTLFIMLYAWDNPKEGDTNTSSKRYSQPFFSFTALLPAYQEHNVIAETLKAVSRINYPDHLKEIIIICHSSDTETIAVVKGAMDRSDKKVRLVLYNESVITKATALNHGVAKATGDVIAIFDAEDEPHRNIYRIVNTVMLKDQIDVVQAGVQLVNYRSTWFSALNVMEYFFWFKSALHFFAKIGVVPLGGNTVFIKKYWVEHIGGWDTKALTEDADMGIRLSQARAPIRVIYDEKHVTKEESPPDIYSFIRQRTRWNQGFLQIVMKGDWLQLTTLKQKLFSFYILTWPIMQTLFFVYLFVSIFMTLSVKLPVSVVLISTLPLYILILQLLIIAIGLYEFTRDYNLRFSWWFPVALSITFLPFYVILGISSFRSLYRLTFNQFSWEKTPHMNAHRAPRQIQSLRLSGI